MVFARKRFGQHFLHDARAIQNILDAINPKTGEPLVEIGPGRGALTAPLLAACGQLDAIEIDRDLAAGLQRIYGAQGLTMHVADALKFNFLSLSTLHGKRLRVLGNLPYNVSTPLLFHLLSTPSAIADLHIMLQREVIERICASPGSHEYGRLTVMDSCFGVGLNRDGTDPKFFSTHSCKVNSYFSIHAKRRGYIAVELTP